jgi:hypothetical protein
MFLDVVSGAMDLFIESIVDGDGIIRSRIDTTYWTFYEAAVRTGDAGALLNRIASILLLITFVELGNGFLLVINQTKTSLQKVTRYSVLAIGFILAVLDIARYGKREAAWTAALDYYVHNNNRSYVISGAFSYDLRVCNQLLAAIDILLWILNLATIAFASFVVHKAKTFSNLRSVCSTCPLTPEGGRLLTPSSVSLPSFSL